MQEELWRENGKAETLLGGKFPRRRKKLAGVKRLVESGKMSEYGEAGSSWFYYENDGGAKEGWNRYATVPDRDRRKNPLSLRPTEKSN